MTSTHDLTVAAAATAYTLDQIDALIDAHMTPDDEGPDSCATCEVLWSRRAILHDLPVPGDLVTFREETPQYRRNAGIVYVVVESPSGEPFSIDNTRPEEGPRPYVWLVVAEDVDLAPSRRRRRTGLATALTHV